MAHLKKQILATSDLHVMFSCITVLSVFYISAKYPKINTLKEMDQSTNVLAQTILILCSMLNDTFVALF